MATGLSRAAAASPPAPAAPAARRAGPLDTTVRLVTPERIVFQYPLAGPFRRLFAYLIDVALLIGLVFVAAIVSLILSLGTVSGLGLILVAYFALVWGYGSFCEALFNGQ